MIKQDFLLVQIEELAKKLAKLLKKKETPGSNTDTLADDCYKDIHLSLQEVQNATAEELTEKVPDWELLELLVKLMLADDRINTDRQQSNCRNRRNNQNLFHNHFSSCLYRNSTTSSNSATNFSNH